VIKFVSDFRQVGDFLWALWFSPPIKLTCGHDITEILLKVALNTINLNLINRDCLLVLVPTCTHINLISLEIMLCNVTKTFLRHFLIRSPVKKYELTICCLV
jgi:hypothetical protein